MYNLEVLLRFYCLSNCVSPHNIWNKILFSCSILIHQAKHCIAAESTCPCTLEAFVPKDHVLYRMLDSSTKIPWEKGVSLKKSFFSYQRRSRDHQALEKAPQRSQGVTIPRSVPKTSRCGTLMGMAVFVWSSDLMILSAFSDLSNSMILRFGVTVASRRIKILKVGKGMFRTPCFCCELEACVLRGSILFFCWWKELQSDQSRANGSRIYKIACDQFRKQLRLGEFEFLSMWHLPKERKGN